MSAGGHNKLSATVSRTRDFAQDVLYGDDHDPAVAAPGEAPTPRPSRGRKIREITAIACSAMFLGLLILILVRERVNG